MKKTTSSVMLKTSFILMCVMMMGTQHVLMPEITGSLTPGTGGVLNDDDRDIYYPKNH